MLAPLLLPAVKSMARLQFIITLALVMLVDNTPSTGSTVRELAFTTKVMLLTTTSHPLRPHPLLTLPPAVKSMARHQFITTLALVTLVDNTPNTDSTDRELVFTTRVTLPTTTSHPLRPHHPLLTLPPAVKSMARQYITTLALVTLVDNTPSTDSTARELVFTTKVTLPTTTSHPLRPHPLLTLPPAVKLMARHQSITTLALVTLMDNTLNTDSTARELVFTTKVMLPTTTSHPLRPHHLLLMPLPAVKLRNSLRDTWTTCMSVISRLNCLSASTSTCLTKWFENEYVVIHDR